MIEEHWLLQHVRDGIDGLRQKSLAVDVGANVGSWSTMLSREFVSVIAIEPDERASNAAPRLPNVHIIPGCIADAPGTRTLYLRPNAGQNSLLVDHPIGAGSQAPAPVVGELECQCHSLDSLLPGGADFVKIDIEGGEVMALSGMADASRWVDTFLVVECHDTLDAVMAELSRLGKTATVVPHPFVGAHRGHCWVVAR
jgi:FkbM family methyltransferase